MTKRSIFILSWSKEGRGRSAFFKGIAVVSLLIPLLVCVSCEGQKEATSGSRINSPPVIAAVRIHPEEPTQENDLAVSVESQDPNGDPITYVYQWMKNDGEIPGGNTNFLKKENFRKGDIIRVKVTAGDGKGTGTPFDSTPVKVRNSPPLIQEASIEPKVAYTAGHLKAVCKSEDKDGDFIYFTYQWDKNGEALDDEKGEMLEGGQFKKGDSIAVTVTPDDREVLGNPKKSHPVVLLNSAPVITSSPPSRMEGNVYLYQVKVNDPDNDPITFALKSGPKGMKIDMNTGQVRWEVQKENKGVHPVEIEAADNEGAKSLQKYSLNVEFRGP